jgi:serine-type D-Ala-D-Ala carboxypeptidase/endopeptidase
MFLKYILKRIPLLFTLTIFLVTIVTSQTISFTFGLTPSTNSSYSASTSSSLATLQNEKNNNLTSTFKITDQIKALLNERIDKNKTNAAIAIGLIDPNGTQFYGHGKVSNTNTTTVDQNTIFAIGSITKVFTTTLLADMVNQGLIKLDDPIEKYLPSNIKIPQYNGHKITIEDLATHTSGLSNFPSQLLYLI